MYTVNHRVSYSVVNERGQLRLPALVDYFQDCSTFQSMDAGVYDFRTTMRFWVLCFWQIKLMRLPELGEPVSVSTWPSAFDKLYGHRNFVMRGESGEDLAVAHSLWVLMDRTNGRMCKITDSDSVGYILEPAYPMPAVSRKIDIDPDAESKGAFVVTADDIDTNQHVNNAAYVRMALRYLPEGFAYDTVHVQYKKAALKGATIYTSVSVSEKKCAVYLADGDGDLHVATEFIIC